jgi:hypothetical protein
LDLFKELETAFAELVLPRKNEKGEYYRRLHKLEAYDTAKKDSLGVGLVPDVSRELLLGRDSM